MYIPDEFYLYDDRCRDDDIHLNKKEIIFVDNNVILLKKEVENKAIHFLINIETREVLNKDFDFYYACFFDINRDDYYTACSHEQREWIDKYSYLISKAEIEKAALSGSGFQDAWEKAYSNIRKQFIEIKKDLIRLKKIEER